MTPAARRAWRRLTPNQRRLLSSHRPDELERDEDLRLGTMADLERALGPREWTPAAARVEEGGKDSSDDARGGDDGCATLEEVGAALGITRESARMLQEKALRKIRGNPALMRELFEHLYGERRR